MMSASFDVHSTCSMGTSHISAQPTSRPPYQFIASIPFQSPQDLCCLWGMSELGCQNFHYHTALHHFKFDACHDLGLELDLNLHLHACLCLSLRATPPGEALENVPPSSSSSSLEVGQPPSGPEAYPWAGADPDHRQPPLHARLNPLVASRDRRSGRDF
jgi:hypothetical protein